MLSSKPSGASAQAGSPARRLPLRADALAPVCPMGKPSRHVRGACQRNFAAAGKAGADNEKAAKAWALRLLIWLNKALRKELWRWSVRRDFVEVQEGIRVDDKARPIARNSAAILRPAGRWAKREGRLAER